MVSKIARAAAAPSAQPALARPQVPLIIDQADAAAFREIMASTVPQLYHGALLRWYNDMVRRQQAAQAAIDAAGTK